MEKYNILFNGYRRDVNKAGLPTYSGIYIVYRCIFNEEKQTVSLKELLYIGQAKNIQERISTHDKRQEFMDALIGDEQICYSYAEVKEQDLNTVENALVYAQKPRLNKDLIDSYKYEPAQFNIEGKCSLLNFTNFSIE